LLENSGGGRRFVAAVSNVEDAPQVYDAPEVHDAPEAGGRAYGRVRSFRR
jgi:hypothetical protein